MSIWDDPEMKPPADDFVKLEAKGDRVSGLITAVDKHDFGGGDIAPQISFTDDNTGEARTWTAGQLQAKRKLADLRPEPGDWFSAELTNVEKRAGGKTLKHIDISVNQGGPPARRGQAGAPLNNHASSPVLNKRTAPAATAFDDQPPF
jgi:hypothetical protein